MANKVSANSINSLDDDWGKDVSNNLPYSGAAVQAFLKKQIKSKIGYQCWSTDVDSSNFYHIWGFATKNDAQEYIADPEGNKDLLLSDEALPISTKQGDSYGAYLYGTTKSTTDFVVNGDSFVVPLRFCAVRTSNGDRINMSTNGTIVIQRSTDNGVTWTTSEERKGILPSTDYSDTSSFTNVDIGNCISTGKQKIRIRAYYTYTDENGATKTQTSAYVVIGNSITKTTLSLTCQLNWQTPLLASVYAERGFPISYMVYGAVVKTLHISITGGNGTTMPEITYALTANDDSTTISKNIQDSTDTYKLLAHGVRTVKAWLTCDDGNGGTITSDVLVNRFMVVNPDTSGIDKTKPYVLLQNVIEKADNYAQVDICQYAVYSPSVADDGTITNTGAAVPVIFYLTAYAETFPDDAPEEYFRIEENATPGTQYTLNTTIEIENSDTSQTEIPAYFRVYRKASDGTEVNAMVESQNMSNTVIKVDNSESYAPKAGADFVLNPKTRNNTETNPKTIINAKTGKTVESTWTGFGLVRDGWLTSDLDGQKVLRVPAGAKINFKYNPFAQFLTTPDSAMELELDFCVRNVTNETDPIISLFENFTVTDADGNSSTTFRGLKMLPLKGNVYTKSKAVDSETDFSWREGVRTHVAINIHNAVAPNKNDAIVPDSSTLDIKATKIALVRVFINGDIEREFKYSITDAEEFGSAAMGNGGFTIGQDGADIDIYSIRIYQNNALEASDVLNDYISTLPTSAEKQAVRKQNDILTSGKIDLEKCRAIGKRCLVWHGTEPYKENTSAQLGWWEIFQYDKEGNYLPKYSGTLCKETKSLKATRQGSTANTYYYSNLQTKMADVKKTINVLLTDLHSSITYEIKETTATDGTVTKTVSLKGGNLGKNFPTKETAVEYPYTEVNGQAAVTVPDGWVDGNGKYRGIGYIVAEGTPMAQKLVNKINYASSMQSHLTGINNLYNDLHKAIVGKNSLQEDYSEARVSKYTEPFLFFTQAEGSDTPIYRGPCTFGAGKMDKPTWGYVKKLHPNFFMIEGSDNNYDLTDMRVPFTWGDENCPENITYSADDEGFFYNGKQCLDFDAGATEDDGTPKSNIISIIQNAWNFLYLHSPMIQYYKGTFDAFQKSDAAKNVFNKYWCTDGDEAYKLKRYDYVNNKWVNAGLWNSSTHAWEVIDLRTDEITKATYEASVNQSEYAKLNVELRAAIVSHAKKYIGFYFRTDSLKLYYAFIIHLMAGTDSCSKNTYFVGDPTAVEVTINGETRTCYLMEMHTDDVDTALPIDNNGRSTKPYYIDRMHPYVDGDNTTEKYEGMHNVLFNLCEEMWEGTKELQSMVKTIFTTMESLVKESDYIDGWTGGSKVSVYGCLWKYIYYVQAYIPQVAFNEAARIRYEYPEMLGFVSYGSGARGVRPITQSNGSLLQCELQFIIRRLVLMASYAAWGPFFDGKSGNLGISDATESFSMQAFHTPDSATSLNQYTFNVTPHQYLYPTGMMGQTNIDPHTRVAPGETFALNLGSTSSNDTGMSIMGINFYRSIGNIGDLSTTPTNTITVNGKRLVEFKAEPSTYYTDSDSGVSTPAFRPGAIVVSAVNIKDFSMKGCSATTGDLNLTGLTRLETLDVRQTKLTTVELPETNQLTSVKFPSTIQAVEVTNQPNLATLTLEGYANLTKYIVKGNKKVDTFAHVTDIYAVKPSGLKTVQIDNIAWTTTGRQCNVDMLMYLAEVKAALMGVIYMLAATADKPLTLAHKVKLCALYDDIDSTSNSLYIKYDVRAINKISISGTPFMAKMGDYQFDVNPSPATGNNIAIKNGKLDILWSLSDSAAYYATWKDANTGLLIVNKLSDATLDLKHTMTVTANTMAGASLSASRTVGFYRHIPKVGDFAYADGTFDSDWDKTRDLVGQVFMRIPITDSNGKVTGYDVRIYAKENLQLVSNDDTPTTWTRHRWGLYPDDTNGFMSSESAIKEATQLSSVFDITTLTNKTNRWGGKNDYEDSLHTIPNQAVDTVLADTPTKDYATYKATWDAYYTALDALYAALQDKDSSYTYSSDNRAKQDVIYTIAESGTIAKADKDTLTTKGWTRARSCYNDLTSAANSYGIASSDAYTTFKAAFQAVADMLNNGVSYTKVSDERVGPSWLTAWSFHFLGDATFLDDDNEDGYKEFPSTCAAGDFDGKSNTEKIVAQAKTIIGDYLQSSWPTTMQELANAMDALVTANASATNSWRYEEFYYPAAFGCSLYQPNIENLDSMYKKGNWYLPAEGELMRLYNFYRQGVTADKAAAGTNEARTPIIANANSKAGRTVLTFTNDWYWASSENSAWNGWSVYFNSGLVLNWSTKYHNLYVRPCTAFTFSL